jgi:hypothetical protein
MAGVLGTAIAAMGVTAAAGIAAAIDAGAQLQSTLANVQVNTGATADDMERFKENAQDLQSTVGANMQQMADGFRQAFDVTKNVNIALAENTVATKDAVAANGDAGQFTNALAVAMHEYQLDLDKTTGQQLDFNAAMQQSQVTMGMLVMGARDAGHQPVFRRRSGSFLAGHRSGRHGRNGHNHNRQSATRYARQSGRAGLQRAGHRGEGSDRHSGRPFQAVRHLGV